MYWLLCVQLITLMLADKGGAHFIYFIYCNWSLAEVAENGNTRLKYKYLKIVLNHSTWVNVLSYIMGVWGFQYCKADSHLTGADSHGNLPCTPTCSGAGSILSVCLEIWIINEITFAVPHPLICTLWREKHTYCVCCSDNMFTF